MKYLKALVAVSALTMLLAGCGEKLQITANPVKDVQTMQYQDEQLNVYCVTGICQFELSSNKDITLTVNMHYSETRSFDKIEGVSVTGSQGSTVQMLGGNRFSMALVVNDSPTKIQVVDYYR